MSVPPVSAPSHYAALGLTRDFTPELLKKNYRALAMKWHPDRNHGNEEEATEKFKGIQEAFNVLSDLEQRREYDMELALRRAKANAGRPKPPPSRPPPTRPAPARPTAPAQQPAAAESTGDASTEGDAHFGDDGTFRPRRPPPSPRYTEARKAQVERERKAPTQPESWDPHEWGRRHEAGGPPRSARAASRAAADAETTTGPSSSGGGEDPTEWEDMRAALELSEREAADQARREERQALEEVRRLEEREAAEIAEALRMVAEAEEREAYEEAMGFAWAEQTTSATAGDAAEQQLAALMELGFHAELCTPLCDGVTPLEELVERLMSASNATGDGPTSSSDVGGAPVVGVPVVGTPVFYPAGGLYGADETAGDDVFPEGRRQGSGGGRRWFGARRSR